MAITATQLKEFADRVKAGFRVEHEGKSATCLEHIYYFARAEGFAGDVEYAIATGKNKKAAKIGEAVVAPVEEEEEKEEETPPAE